MPVASSLKAFHHLSTFNYLDRKERERRGGKERKKILLL
jgi:hypothetical protein